MQHEQQKYREDVDKIHYQGSNKPSILIPHKYVCGIICQPYVQRVYQTQNSCQGLEINQYFNQLHIGSLRYLRIDGWNESDKRESQGGYTGNSTRKSRILEENHQSDKTKDPQRYKDLNQVGSWIFVQRYSEVHILEIFNFRVIIFFRLLLR